MNAAVVAAVEPTKLDATRAKEPSFPYLPNQCAEGFGQSEESARPLSGRESNARSEHDVLVSLAPSGPAADWGRPYGRPVSALSEQVLVTQGGHQRTADEVVVVKGSKAEGAQTNVPGVGWKCLRHAVAVHAPRRVNVDAKETTT